MMQLAGPPAVQEPGTRPIKERIAGLAFAIARSRFVVLLAVLAVLASAISLFLIAAWSTVISAVDAFADLARGEPGATDPTVRFFKIVTLTLKAVAFYVIGIGLYELFIGRLRFPTAIHVDSLSDLEGKVVSLIIVILSTTFLERFTEWRGPLQTLQFGVATAAVVAALVLFQMYLSKERSNGSPHEHGSEDTASDA
jgi:uncharacterized membrane protein YqhA